jgi:creatinine amidohydrolase
MATQSQHNPYYLAEMAWPQIEEYLKKSQTIILPVGSTEQHGPNGLLGIDFLSSFKLALAAGKQTKTLVSPPLPFGMALHHMAFPGTISFTPLTYIKVLTEVFQSLQKHGFKKIWVINGHGGNITSITSAFCEFLNSDQTMDFQLINWWHLDEVTRYEKEVFQDKNGFHATCGEVSLTMYTHEEAYENNPKPEMTAVTSQKTGWPLSPIEFRKQFPDGRMGSMPSLSTPQHGKIIFDRAVNAIVKKLEAK